MLSIDYCKKFLCTQEKQYSEKEIELLRDSLYQTAEILVEKYLQKKNQTNALEKSTMFPISISD